MAQRIADSPEFFLQLIQLVFRSKKEKKKSKPSKERRQKAENAYRLLRAWRIVPDINREGVFDAKAFANWVTKSASTAHRVGLAPDPARRSGFKKERHPVSLPLPDAHRARPDVAGLDSDPWHNSL